MPPKDVLIAPYIPYTICSHCKKCRAVCPAGINIPEMLKIYGQYMENGIPISPQIQKVESKGLPIDCIECGACSAHCPQEIEVKEVVRNLAMLQSGEIIPVFIHKSEMKVRSK